MLGFDTLKQNICLSIIVKFQQSIRYKVNNVWIYCIIQLNIQSILNNKQFDLRYN
jgi:hypothetical protein